MKRGVTWILAAAASAALIVDARAEGRGHGGGRGAPATAEDTVKQAGRKAVDEAVDATMDELVGEDSASTPSGGPPGLNKKGKLPPGLEKQGKTPPGWSKGKKEGWDKDGPQPQRQEGLIRRTIRGIFRRGQQPAAQPQ